MELRVLGDVEAWMEGRRMEVGHARQRCVLVVLVVDANRAVTVDQLLERVWSQEPPQRGRQALRSYLSRLRRLFSPAGVGIERRSNGYILVADPDSVDLHLFRRVVADARAADGEHALELFEQALALWRGEPFAGLDTPWLATVRGRMRVVLLGTGSLSSLPQTGQRPIPMGGAGSDTRRPTSARWSRVRTPSAGQPGPAISVANAAR
ncbi:AfsR/SARP family transcriptional regulator [Lentzea tibetensis]|nr:winged helix-turn-helix domain-containing protein [Lentzea tibetensis]